MYCIGFDPNSVLSGGWTALLYSCDHGHYDIIKLLLEKGANPNAHKGTKLFVMQTFNFNYQY